MAQLQQFPYRSRYAQLAGRTIRYATSRRRSQAPARAADQRGPANIIAIAVKLKRAAARRGAASNPARKRSQRAMREHRVGAQRPLPPMAAHAGGADAASVTVAVEQAALAAAAAAGGRCRRQGGPRTRLHERSAESERWPVVVRRLAAVEASPAPAAGAPPEDAVAPIGARLHLRVVRAGLGAQGLPLRGRWRARGA